MYSSELTIVNHYLECRQIKFIIYHKMSVIYCLLSSIIFQQMKYVNRIILIYYQQIKPKFLYEIKETRFLQNWSFQGHSDFNILFPLFPFNKFCWNLPLEQQIILMICKFETLISWTKIIVTKSIIICE